MFLVNKSNPTTSDTFWFGLARFGLVAAGVIFALVAFAWTIILSGLLNTALLQTPLWWLTALLWAAFMLFTATLQTLRLRGDAWPHWQSSRFLRKDVKLLPEEDSWSLVKGRLTLAIPQVSAALELPFRHMGVRTEEHRQEIETALRALYHFDADQEALSLCLDRLLQAAKQNWVGLAVFSPREQEILELLLQNCTYKEMGSRLHVSPSTIKTHIYHIFQKLDVSNRDEAVRLIDKRGWFSTQSQQRGAASC